MMNKITEVLHGFWLSVGVSESSASLCTKAVMMLLIILLAVFVEKIGKRVIMGIIRKFVSKTKISWDDIIFAPEVTGKLFALIAPILVYIFIPLALDAGSEALDVVRRLCMVYIIAMFARFISSLLSAFFAIYDSKQEFKGRPMKGLLQTLQIILYFIAGIAIVSILVNKSPLGILAGLGASAAILMLVFQDSILGFVSGIQLSANNMLRVGDWIEMPKYGVDGDVLEVTLNTVKVQNFDRTIVTIPPTLLMKDSFKNWRGMQDAGGRRVKRSVYVDMNSVKFCTPEMLDRYRKIHYLKNYIDGKEKVLAGYNEEHHIDNTIEVNGRRQTNLGVFRAYLVNYLKNHPSVHHGMTCMVRQLQPTELGLPLELYFFTNTTVWVDYEDIQSDIFDHVLAVITSFDLNVFQNLGGKDMRCASRPEA